MPHSFSTMVCLSLEAIDITAALARCAMSREWRIRRLRRRLGIDRLGIGAIWHRPASAPVRSARAGRALSTFVFGASASLGVPAAFGASTGGGIRQPGRLDGPGRFALRRRRGKPFVKHKRSRDVLRRGNQRGPVRQRRKDLIEVRPRRPRRDDGGTRDQRAPRTRRCSPWDRCRRRKRWCRRSRRSPARGLQPQRCQGNSEEGHYGKISRGFEPQDHTHAYSYSFTRRPEQFHQVPL